MATASGTTGILILPDDVLSERFLRAYGATASERELKNIETVDFSRNWTAQQNLTQVLLSKGLINNSVYIVDNFQRSRLPLALIGCSGLVCYGFSDEDLLADPDLEKFITKLGMINYCQEKVSKAKFEYFDQLGWYEDEIRQYLPNELASDLVSIVSDEFQHEEVLDATKTELQNLIIEKFQIAFP